MDLQPLHRDGTPRGKAVTLADLLTEEHQFIIVLPGERTLKNEVVYGQSTTTPDRFNKGIYLLDPKDGSLYHARPASGRRFEILGTASFVWDSDKYGNAPRFEIHDFEALREEFEKLGFLFP